jgi:hypothetical protein
MIVPTFIFPFSILTLYCKQIKQAMPLPDLHDDMEVEDLKYLYGTIDIEIILKNTYTNSNHQKIMQSYGALIKDLNIEKNGKNISILLSVY